MQTQNTKRPATKKGAVRRQTIRQRAGLIIADTKGYDADTRDAIFNSLESDDPATLAELVKRAEKGDISLNCTAPAHPAPETDELQQFAHHLSEAMRIARTNPVIPASLYNDLSDAWNNFENDLPRLIEVNESEVHVLVALETYARQITEQTAKGGTR